MAYVVIGKTVLPAKSYSSVNVDMIIGAPTFQTGLASRTTSYPSIAGSGSAMAGRASASCSRTFRSTVSS